MPHGPSTTPSKGRCIYCYAVDRRLSDEHIVPFSFGGQHVIQKASCQECADITSRFEKDVMRELWGDARNAVNAPSRRKNKRPTHINVGYPNSIRITYNDYPPAFVFYKMTPPGILRGIEPDLDTSYQWTFSVICDEKRLNEFSTKYQLAHTAKFRNVPHSFGRMIAKIGYGHILIVLDIADFNPLILDIITGKNKNISYLVGDFGEEIDPKKGIGYELSTILHGTVEGLWIIAKIRLLANCHTPTYLVVVGQTSNIEQTTNVINKFGLGKLYLFPS